ncbi:hypothetical protein ACTQ46_04400 [Gallicola sp. Sow4_E12]|uniref:hypothetical protein n=1 Tax=Gallicola sp. Sow4_E12 TaxID=3438785 RepID=UPI003F8DC141
MKNKYRYILIGVVVVLAIYIIMNQRGINQKEPELKNEDSTIYTIGEKIQNEDVEAVLESVTLERELNGFDISKEELNEYLTDEVIAKDDGVLKDKYGFLILHFSFVNNSSSIRTIALGDLYTMKENKDPNFIGLNTFVKGRGLQNPNMLINNLSAKEEAPLEIAYLIQRDDFKKFKNDLFSSVSFSPDNTESMNINRVIHLKPIEDKTQ